MSDSIIIGKGLLGRAFEGFHPQDHVVFCSGVSKSNETKKSEFHREKNLLDSISKNNRDKKIIYFSSFIAGKVRSPYAIHKEDMEACVRQHAGGYLIFRLPQVVGITGNTTLVSFLVESIINSSLIYIYRDAKRNLIDVDDVFRIVTSVCNKEVEGETICIGAKHQISVNDIVDRISTILSTPVDKKILEGGYDQKVDLESLYRYLGKNDPLLTSIYPYDVLDRYVLKIAQHLKSHYLKS